LEIKCLLAVIHKFLLNVDLPMLLQSTTVKQNAHLWAKFGTVAETTRQSHD